MPRKNVLSVGLIAIATFCAAAENPTLMRQNWDDSTRDRFWYIDQGSRMMPLEWFNHLERADSEKKFSDRLDRYGFLTSENNFGLRTEMKAAKAKLPIGFSINEKDDWVGITCSACHVGVIRNGAQIFLIEGAPALIDFDLFVKELVDAMEKTIKDPGKHGRFFKEGRANAQPEFTVLLGRHEKRRLMNTPLAPAGFGRLDAFGHIFNQVIVEHLNNDISQAIPSVAPVSFPVLWDIAQHKRVQWNNSAPNLGVGEKGIGSLLRNVGEVIGVFGTVNIIKSNGPLGDRLVFDSSANIKNLRNIEGWLANLRSPQWPLGQLDEAKTKRGAKIYDAYCSSCHPVLKDPSKATRPFPSKPIRISGCVSPSNCVGTEDETARLFPNDRASTEILEGARIKVHARHQFRKFGSSAYAYELTGNLAINITQPRIGFFEGLLATLKAAWVGDQDLMVYKARPLNGIWASAPYLHNGSVPSLWALLQPAAERPQKFCVGDAQYDAVNVGFQPHYNAQAPYCPRDTTSLVDTALRGNRNYGHEFGTHISDSAKWDLIEFLKSL